MVTMQTEAIINAPPEKVWTVLSDFAAYPEWNPTLQKIEGIPGLGEKISLHYKQPNGEMGVDHAVITVFEPDKELRTSAFVGAKFLLHMELEFTLEESGESGQTRLTAAEHFSGLFGQFLGKPAENFRPLMDAMN